MELRLVVGLFRSCGIAEDARNRLKTDGVPGTKIAVTVLKPAAPVLPVAAPELEALSVDPLIFGNVRETFAKFIRNGETVVSVRAATDEEAEFAAQTLRQYSPIAIELMPLSVGSEAARSLSDQNGNACDQQHEHGAVAQPHQT